MYCAATPAQQVQIAYNSCRNRHCPKCQARAARRWLEARQADLLPVDYYHVVFTLPAPISAIAYYNKTLLYDLLFAVAAETLRTIAADPKHLGAQVGVTLVLHTWGSALTHHPHVHGIVPGGGLAPDGERWVACKPGFFLPVRVLSRLFRRRFLEELEPGASRRPAAVLRRVRRTRRRARVRCLARATARSGMGRLCQAPLRRAGRGARLSVALHPPGGHRQQPLARHGRARRHLPLEGLPGQGQHAAQDHDARPPTSSCAASCCTSCPAASTASATTACSPMPDAASISPRRANCCTSFPRGRTAVIGRSAGRQRAAHLRLPALRCRDEHRRDLRSRPTDSRTAGTASCSMSTGIGGINTTSALRRPPPIADGFALRGQHRTSRPLPSSPNPAPDHRHPPSVRCQAPIQQPVGAIAPTCDPSNPHSRLASPNDIGACRGFLPRGLCDACPRGVITSSHPCAAGQASHNP